MSISSNSSMFQQKVGFFGCGRLGSALIKGFLNANTLKKEQIFISTSSGLSSSQAADALKVTSLALEDLISTCDIIFLAVKPYVLLEMWPSLSDKIQPSSVVVSLAAGVELQTLKKEALASGTQICRVMTNVACQYGKGCSFLVGSKDERLLILFSSVGFLLSLEDENLLPALTVATSSGVAFALEFLKWQSSWLEKQGLSSKMAQKVLEQTYHGALSFLTESDSIHQVQDQVVSPGGVTEKGLKGLSALKKEAYKAFDKALNRDKCLGGLPE